MRPHNLNFTRQQPGAVNDTANDTITNFVVQLHKENNERSETGGEDYQNDDWLKEKKGEKMDFGGPGGTGSSMPKSDYYYAAHGSSASTKKPTSYMEAHGQDMNVSIG